MKLDSDVHLSEKSIELLSTNGPYSLVIQTSVDDTDHHERLRGSCNPKYFFNS
jgi:hypothetical protein